MGDLIRKVCFIIGTFFLVYIILHGRYDNVIMLESESKLHDSFVEVKLEEQTFNTVKTQTNAIYNVNHNLSKLGFNCVLYDETEKYIDVAFEKQDVIYRYIYDKTSQIMLIIKNKYEDSGDGISYIIEEVY